MTVYSVIYTRTHSHNFVTEVQVKGIYTDFKEAVSRFNDVELQIKCCDPKYEIAGKENTIKWLENYEFIFWVEEDDDYYEVTLRIVQSNIVNKGENK